MRVLKTVKGFALFDHEAKRWLVSIETPDGDVDFRDVMLANAIDRADSWAQARQVALELTVHAGYREVWVKS